MPWAYRAAWIEGTAFVNYYINQGIIPSADLLNISNTTISILSTPNQTQ
jgi:hypothetical protein